MLSHTTMTTIPLIFAQEDVEFGGKPGITEDFAYNNNVQQSSLNIRMGFLRKVYGLLTIQLTISAIVGAICMFQPEVRTFIHTNDWMVMIALLLSIVFLVALHFKRKEYPTNLFLLAAFNFVVVHDASKVQSEATTYPTFRSHWSVLEHDRLTYKHTARDTCSALRTPQGEHIRYGQSETFVQAYAIGVVLTFYDQVIVLQALVLTLSVVAGLSAFTFQTKRDFSFLGYGLFGGLMLLMVAGIMQLFLGSSVFELVISLAGAFLFAIFIVYDTQMLMKTLSPEEYILATINLYLDIVNLFLYILRALEAVRRQ
uniref:Uncharacterized protein n=1 Tax=Timema douglasi TaxID=61478 RepID=A0A7R8ZA10_TIMDO|nr:unnamed protein product [Timema douglasi]